MMGGDTVVMYDVNFNWHRKSRVSCSLNINKTTFINFNRSNILYIGQFKASKAKKHPFRPPTRPFFTEHTQEK